MKRNGILLIGIFPLLFSCTAKEDNSSNEYLSSEESPASSELSSEKDKDQSLLTKLGNKLLSLEGTVSKSKTVLKRVYTYPSDATFDMYVENNYETTRYKRNTTYLVETKGTEQYEDQTPIPYTTQTYDNGKKFYQVTLYDDEDKTKKTESGKYDEKAVESTYSLGEAYKEIANFNYMLESRDNYLISYRFSNLEGIEEDNKLSYSYSLFIYTENDGQKILSQQISYENIFTIKNDLITHLSQKYENKTVVASAANILTVNLETDYIQGQYTDFSGDLLSII